MGCSLYFGVRSPVFTRKQMAEILNSYSNLPCLPLPFPITEKPIQEGIPFSLFLSIRAASRFAASKKAPCEPSRGQKRKEELTSLTPPLLWRPQGDSNPCYRRERPVSLASRRWGHSGNLMFKDIIINSRCKEKKYAKITL